MVKNGVLQRMELFEEAIRVIRTAETGFWFTGRMGMSLCPARCLAWKKPGAGLEHSFNSP